MTDKLKSIYDFKFLIFFKLLKVFSSKLGFLTELEHPNSTSLESIESISSSIILTPQSILIRLHVDEKKTVALKTSSIQ
jgi:hypothetical protein